MSRPQGAVVLVALLLLLGAAGSAQGEEDASATPWTFVAEGGVFGLDGGGAAFAGLEARHRPLRWGIYPLGGLLVSVDESAHLRLGLGRDFPLGSRWLVGVNSAVGYWEQGDGPDLGSHLEFRSALDVGYRVRDDLRVGLTLAHLSNASTAAVNPGVETLALSIAWRP